MVRSPDRASPVLAAAPYVTTPVPLPVAPPVMVTQSTPLDACHVHPSAAVTTTCPLCAPVNDAAAGAIAKVQLSPAAPLAACDTVSVCPAIVSGPVRAAPVFAL